MVRRIRSKRSDAVVAREPIVERFDRALAQDAAAIGQWYWVHGDDHRGNGSDWLGCVMEVGSNYVEIHSPHSRRGHTSTRVHLDDFDDVLTPEPNAEKIIADQIARLQGRVEDLLARVHEVTHRLGIVPPTQITAQSRDGSSSRALTVAASQDDVGAYKKALVRAKDETLPEIFKQIEEANEDLARWMVAPTMPTRAQIGPMKKSIGAVEDRIYTIELYAGLTEDAVQVRDGDPADISEKLRVMQRRLYMDEECLARYEAGGMEFRDIRTFDEWLSRPENFERILPFRRCLVAFRVRRHEKYRDSDGSLYQAFVNFQLGQEDTLTFLYVRNGEQLWRVSCDFDFGSQIVPDQTEFDPSRPMMVKMFGNRVDGFLPLSAWEELRDQELAEQRKYDEWAAAHPSVSRLENPHYYGIHRHKDYQPFDSSSVYYDDALAKVDAKYKKYNRIAVIVQGLFDRSMVLHPHPPVKVWDPASFATSVEVIYDAATLTHGDAPDFEAYRDRLNSSLATGSLVTGQEDYWLRQEAEKESNRRANDYRLSENMRWHRLERYRPYGNPGPGRVATIAQWRPRLRNAVFRWERERRQYYYGTVPCTLTVPADQLLNVSAYKPGDYRQFFEDPRTRANYLQWAPMLLEAEDYYGRKR